MAKRKSPKHKPPPAETRSSVLFLQQHYWWIIVTFALCVRLLHFATSSHHYPLYHVLLRGIDQYTYHQWAQEIIGGDLFSAQKKIFYYGPLYSYFLALIYSVFGVKLTAALLVNFLLGSLNALLLFLIARRFFSFTVSFLAALLYGLAAPFIFYESHLLMETLVISLNLCFLYFFILGCQGRPFYLLVSGVALGLSATARGNSLFLFPLFFLYLIYVGKKEDQKAKLIVRNLALFSVGLFLSVSPFTVHNRVYGKKWTLLTSNGPVLLYIGNCHDSLGTLAYPPSYEQLKKTYGDQVPWTKELIKDIMSHPLAFFKVNLHKIYLFLNHYDSPDNVNFYLGKRFMPVLRYNPLTPRFFVALGFAGLLLSLRRFRQLGLLYLFLISFAVSIIIVFVVGRYRLSFMALLLPFAAFFAVEVYEYVRRPAQRNLLLALGILLGTSAALAVFPPNIIRYNDYGLIAHAFLNLEDLDNAERYYLRSLDVYKYGASSWQNLSIVYTRQHQLEKAWRCASNAARIEPKEGHLENLVYLSVRLGKFEEAKEALREAQQRFPQAPWVKEYQKTLAPLSPAPSNP